MADNFKTRLDPWAQRWWSLSRDIETWLMESTDDELDSIERDAASPTSTNCWFATFHVAQQIRHAITAERYRRKAAGERNIPEQPRTRPGTSS